MAPPAVAQDPVPDESATGGDGGLAPVTRSFVANLISTATHRDEVRLEVGGESAQSARVGVELEWDFRSNANLLRAAFDPYIEYFTENDLSTYGGVAGLNWERRSTPRRTWSLLGTVAATPEQDVPDPRLDDSPDAPAFRVLVPRNGFVRYGISAGLENALSAVSRLEFSTSLSAVEYESYSVDDEQPSTGSLADQRTADFTARFEKDLSERMSWNLQATASRTELSGGESGPGIDESRDTRDQRTATGGISRQYRIHFLSASAGVSTQESGDGNSDPALVFAGTWAASLERRTYSVTARRTQGVYSSSRASVNRVSVTGRYEQILRGNNRFEVSGQYGVSERTSGGGGDVVSQIYNALYAWRQRTWSWTVSAMYARQESDAGFGGDQEVKNLSFILSWRFAGRAQN